MSYKKIVFDTRVRKWLYLRVAFSSSLRSGANVYTKIKSLFRTCIENNYFDIVCVKFDFTHRLPGLKCIFTHSMHKYFTHGRRCVKSNFTHTMLTNIIDNTSVRFTHMERIFGKRITEMEADGWLTLSVIRVPTLGHRWPSESHPFT